MAGRTANDWMPERLAAAEALAELEKTRADSAEYDALLLRAENQKLWEFIEMLVKARGQ